uniref:Uncharacterized protein n=1 Tax=Anguilla anguilla TaxID=7936 RepID=A0A0E9VI53_ANGAN
MLNCYIALYAKLLHCSLAFLFLL